MKNIHWKQREGLLSTVPPAATRKGERDVQCLPGQKECLGSFLVPQKILQITGLALKS